MASGFDFKPSADILLEKGEAANAVNPANRQPTPPSFDWHGVVRMRSQRARHAPRLSNQFYVSG